MVPTIIPVEKKIEYINALIEARNTEDETFFSDFMFGLTAEGIAKNIREYNESQNYEPPADSPMNK